VLMVDMTLMCPHSLCDVLCYVNATCVRVVCVCVLLGLIYIMKRMNNDGVMS
jgi:hypothetical protein